MAFVKTLELKEGFEIFAVKTCAKNVVEIGKNGKNSKFMARVFKF